MEDFYKKHPILMLAATHLPISCYRRTPLSDLKKAKTEMQVMLLVQADMKLRDRAGTPMFSEDERLEAMRRLSDAS